MGYTSQNIVPLGRVRILHCLHLLPGHLAGSPAILLSPLDFHRLKKKRSSNLHVKHTVQLNPYYRCGFMFSTHPSNLYEN